MSDPVRRSSADSSRHQFRRPVHPRIVERITELLPPLVVAGLPRTGTTHLHNLLAAGPTFRTIPYWESVEPYPLPAEHGIEPDPRKARMDVAVEYLRLQLKALQFIRGGRAAPLAAQIAASWTERLDALVRDRDLIPPGRSIDVRFDEFMADELATVAQIHDLAGEPMTEEARVAMLDYLERHTRNRLGRVATSADMFGFDERDLASRFARYRERFSV